MTPPLLSAPVSGSSAWIIAMLLRESLPQRVRQLECDPHVSGDVVRHLRVTAAAISEAAAQYKALVDLSRSLVADSVEVSSSGFGAGLANLPGRWVDVGEVAVSLNCSKRWVTALIQQGRLVAAKHGREWRIDVSSVEDFKRRGVAA